MKKFKYLLVGGLLACTTVASTACNFGPGGSDDSSPAVDYTGNEITIVLQTDGGGLGFEWAEKAGARFTESVRDKQYGNYTGAKIKVQSGTGADLSDATNGAVALYDLSGVDSVTQAVSAAYDITDLMKEKYDRNDEGVLVSIEDKIEAGARARYQVNGKYVALPSTEYYPSVSYDVNLFDEIGCYLAQEGYGTSYTSTILGQAYNFTAVAGEKACGPDGKTGTDDDGLPTSLYELIAMCEYIMSPYSGASDVSLFNFSGKESYYSDFMLSALMNSMMGWEKAQAMYTLQCDAMEIVTGFKNEPLFSGWVDGPKAPITATVEITEENGYLTTWAVEKYYTEAFMDLLIDQQWFSASATNSGANQGETMEKFIYSGVTNYERIAMHIDGSFWYNEASLRGYIKEYEELQSESMGNFLGDGRKVAMMSLPVSFKDSVVENQGRGQVFVDMWRSMLVVNKHAFTKLAGLQDATLDFVKFLYTYDELAAYTELTSVRKTLNYAVSEESNNLSYYGKRLMSMINNEDNKILYFEGNNQTFTNNPTTFVPVSWGDGGMFSVGKMCYYTYRTSQQKSSAQTIFKGQSITKDVWQSKYAGANSVTGDYDAIN